MLAASTVLILASLSASDQPRLYEFTADSCPACRAMVPTISQLKAAGVPIQTVDVNQHRDWARKARVTGIPSYVAVANGREVGRLVGASGYSKLEQLYQTAVRQSQSPTRDESVVRGQAPSPQRPRHRLGEALSNLVGGATKRDADCQCQGPCQCPPTGTVPLASSPTHEAPAATVPGATSNPVAAPTPAACDPRSRDCRASSETPTVNGSDALGTDNGDPTERAMAATVRLKIEDNTGCSYGTGTIIDVHGDEALVVTCGHIFRDSGGKGRILCDLFGAGAPRGVVGSIVSYDLRRDVGLISMRPGVAVRPVPTGGTGYMAQKGDAVFSIGCNKGDDPTVIQNKIIAVNRYHGPPNLVVGGRPVDGRSGGGLFASDGTLIGVCNAADPEYDEGLYAALGNVHAELDSVGLAAVYRGRPTAIARNDNRPSARTQPAVATLSSTPTLTPVTTPPRPPQPRMTEATPPLASASPSAQIAPSRELIASVKSSASNTNEPEAEAELICILRRRDQTPREHVFVLDRPSPDLIQRLAAEANRRGPHMATQLHVTSPARETSVQAPPRARAELDENGWNASPRTAPHPPSIQD